MKYAVFGIRMACHDRGAFRWEDNVCRGEVDSDDELGRFERPWHRLHDVHGAAARDWRHLYMLIGIVWGCGALERKYQRINCSAN